MIFQLWFLKDNGRIDINDFETRFARQRRRMLQEHDARRTFPTRIGIGEMHPDVAQCGGAEHGIGRIKVEELTHYRSKIELDVMRSLKRALDPDNLMNPGKVIQV